MRWQHSWRADPVAVRLADRHYNRQSHGSDQFVPPGRCVVLRTPEGDAVWVTSWPKAEYVKHQWAGAWLCSIFRNESPHLSSELIEEALAATLWFWPTPPELGMITFIDPDAVRRKRDPGRCFRRAGFKPVGFTKEEGLVALQLDVCDMPTPEAPFGSQQPLFALAEGL
jgi:hypothetical protein